MRRPRGPSQRKRPALGDRPPCVMKEGRSMRRSIPFAAALLVLVLAASPVVGATSVIKMNSSEDYVPARVTIARGDSVRWKNIATSYLDHDVYGTAPNGYFASP